MCDYATTSEPETYLQLSLAPCHRDHLVIRLSLAPRQLVVTQTQGIRTDMGEVSTKPPDPVTRLKRLL